MFESKNLAQLFTLMYPNITIDVESAFNSCSWHAMPTWMSTIVGFDSVFIPYLCGSIVQWILQMVSLVSKIQHSGFLLTLPLPI